LHPYGFQIIFVTVIAGKNLKTLVKGDISLYVRCEKLYWRCLDTLELLTQGNRYFEEAILPSQI